MKLTLIVAGMAALALVGTAQEKKTVEERVMVIAEAQGTAGGPLQTVSLTHFEAGAVKGAPYAAEATNETIQTLADGNRIVDKNTTRMYRDAEGRTRVENSFGTLGALMPEGKAPSITSINDPVSGAHYILDNNRKTATKMTLPKLATTGKPGERREVRVEMRMPPPAGATIALAPAGQHVELHQAPAGASAVTHDVMMAGPATIDFRGTGIRHMDGTSGGPNVNIEGLGKQVIEGVECEGTRETTTIPAGQMGNERPLVSVTERWYSEKLKLEVLRKHTDPRFGETNYRLTRIVQADQPRNLFEIPADYKVEVDPGGNVVFDRKIKEVKE